MRNKLLVFIAIALVVASCHKTANKAADNTAKTGESTAIATTEYCYTDSSRYSKVELTISLPDSTSAATAAMRTTLLDKLYEIWSRVGVWEGDTRLMASYDAKHLDVHKAVNYYGKCLGTYFTENAIEDNLLTGREYIMNWEYSSNLQKLYETENFVTFYSQDYSFMGGAHGSIGGAGYLTFDKTNGALLEDFFVPNAAKAMQPLLRKGICQYYKECGVTVTEEELPGYLLIDSQDIPLPAWAPCPDTAGLTLLYQQYEIVCYADGMVTFTIPYSEVAPYLTNKAKQVIGLKP